MTYTTSDFSSDKPNVLVIIGSASSASSNAKLMELLAAMMSDDLLFTIFDDLGSLPHFDPSKSESLPVRVAELLGRVAVAPAVIFCSPEYIFSIPARLKNLLEWCVSTTVFLDKPVALITASADGQQGHAQLRLIMETLGARLSEGTELIIPGIKGKFDEGGVLNDNELLISLMGLGSALRESIMRA
ncbi:NADPH-dependent FMN reductase [Pedobacter sp. MC2016-24]|uniref:NADPH-dependent FMN reductase n=1 Tax=Pedobacter sp. MC2016-24 TaxID=2780090 RepID=UPI00188062C2|nr:NADPH-dependent FMN reductase [Pedobacter sp. MC2016-24]MBE9600713.1 NAD(P)H-dependent oxidoreductase [Pedobacter sp. MC2016-24]